MAFPPVTPSSPNPLEKLCAVCKKTGADLRLCDNCEGIYYCSPECQTDGQPLHDILCQAYVECRHPQDQLPGSHYRAIFFSSDNDEPEILWVSREDSSRAGLVGLLGEPPYHTSYVTPAREIEILSREQFLTDGREVNKSIEFAVSMTPTESSCEWRGPVLLRRLHQGTAHTIEERGDATLADFHFAVEWLAEYSNAFAPQNAMPHPKGGCRPCEAVRIKCTKSPTDVLRRPLDVDFVPEIIAEDHPIRSHSGQTLGEVSPISKMLGMPMRLIHVLPTDTKCRVAGYSNPAASFLMADFNVASDRFGLIPRSYQVRAHEGHYLPDFLAVRSDYQDLTPQEVFALAHFVAARVVPKWMDLSETEGNNDATRQRVADFITKDNYLKVFEERGLEEPASSQSGPDRWPSLGRQDSWV